MRRDRASPKICTFGENLNTPSIHGHSKSKKLFMPKPGPKERYDVSNPQAHLDFTVTA